MLTFKEFVLLLIVLHSTHFCLAALGSLPTDKKFLTKEVAYPCDPLPNILLLLIHIHVSASSIGPVTSRPAPHLVDAFRRTDARTLTKCFSSATRLKMLLPPITWPSGSPDLTLLNFIFRSAVKMLCNLPPLATT